MKKAIRCCISCILPCGALDVIRIVHVNGRVEEFSNTVKAAEIMKLYPKHVLKKPSLSPPPPCSSQEQQGICPRIVILPPDAQLQRGKIYFLVPVPVPPASSTPAKARSRSSASVAASARRKKKETTNQNSNNSSNNNGNVSAGNLVVSDRYLSEILSEKVSTQRDRRRGRVGVWRPHLESISETSNEV